MRLKSLGAADGQLPGNKNSLLIKEWVADEQCNTNQLKSMFMKLLLCATIRGKRNLGETSLV